MIEQKSHGYIITQIKANFSQSNSERVSIKMKIALILCFVQYLAFLAEATNTFDFNPALFHSAANGREVSPVVNRDDQVDFPGETESSEEVDDKAEHLMSLAGRNPDLAMFAAGVSRSKELAEMLADEDAGPFTIFAPNNRAFAKVRFNSSHFNVNVKCIFCPLDQQERCA